MSVPQPAIGEWYRLHGEQLFEVVAVDEDSRTIEVQYFDGTVEELELDDWREQWKSGALEAAEAPEDWSGSVDVEGEDESAGALDSIDTDRRLNAGSLEDLDLFD
jgi:Family of unknown function (DUF6763)